MGFVRPTSIQAATIPGALEGRDVLASAETGSGKTAAFLLPILHNIIGKSRGSTRALVLVPTRELAAQVLADMQDLAVHTPVTGAAVFGGVGPGPQEHAFRSGVDVIVATPGRLLDHLRRPYAKLDRIEHLVLDEADRMLDMGFLPEIRKILRFVPARRQTLFFSATMPPPIRELTRDMLRNPLNVRQERATVTPAGITQAVYPVPQELKSALLVALLRRGDIDQVLVFTRTKHRANRLADFLTRAGVHAGRIHGNRSQAQRTQALEAFKNGRVPVLVATDIAARGIDVDALGHVINFDVPLVPEDYIHRVGRTGRAEATGEAFTFVSPEERGELAAIERAVGRKLPAVTLPDFDYTARPQARLEIPVAERMAEHRARRGQAHSRSSGQGRSTGSGQGRHDAPARPHGSGHGGRQPGGPPADRSAAGNGGAAPAGRKWRFRPRRRAR
jgi:ATP-dependent RNA helicase RhlE